MSERIAQWLRDDLYEALAEIERLRARVADLEAEVGRLEELALERYERMCRDDRQIQDLEAKLQNATKDRDRASAQITRERMGMPAPESGWINHPGKP